MTKSPVRVMDVMYDLVGAPQLASENAKRVLLSLPVDLLCFWGALEAFPQLLISM
jgi:hypothetical protein